MIEKTVNDSVQNVLPYLIKFTDKTKPTLPGNNTNWDSYLKDKTFFDQKMNQASSTPYKFVESEQTHKNPDFLNKISDPEIKNKLQTLLDKLSYEPETLNYFNDLLFTRSPQLNKGETIDIFDRLSKILDKKYDSRIGNAKSLAISTLKDISAPFSISQENTKNCAAVAIQMQMAIIKPLEYLKMIDTLASGQPYKIKGQNNVSLKLSFNAVEKKAADSISGKIIYSALDLFNENHKTQNKINTLFDNKLSYYELDTVEDIEFPETKFIPFIEQIGPSRDNPIHLTFIENDRRDSFYLVQLIGINTKENTATIINQKGKEEKISIPTLKEKTLGIFMSETFKDIYTNNSNPLKAKLSNISSGKFISLLSDSSITSEGLKKQITDKYHQPEIQEKIYVFLTKSGNEKETNIYLNELMLHRNLSLANLNIILDKLNCMLDTKYLPNTKELVISALHDVAAPSDISQGNVGTCAGTSIQIQLALKDPVQYLSMLDTLARNKDYKTVSGKIIKPNWTFGIDNNPDNKYDRYQGRTISGGIMQNAIMDFANGKAKFDSSLPYDDIDGLSDSESKRVKDAIFGIDSAIYSITDYSSEQLISILTTAHPSRINPIDIGLDYADKGRDSSHAVVVIGLDKSNKTVTIINPYGREEIFPINKLKERITSIVDTKEAGSKIIKLSESDFSKILNLPGDKNGTDNISEIINNNSWKSADFINSLKLNEKVRILKKILYTGKVTESDKTAALRILENIFKGSQAQGSETIAILTEKLNDLKIGFSNLLNKVKTDSKLFYDVAVRVSLSDSTYGITSNLINNPATQDKFLKNISFDQKVDIANDLGECLAYNSEVSPQDKKAMIILLKDLITKTSEQNKLYSELSLKAKITALSLGDETANLFLYSMDLDQQMLLHKSIGDELLNSNINKKQSQKLQEVSLTLIKTLIKDFDEESKNAVLKTLSVFIGRNNDLFQTDKDAFKQGVKNLGKYLPPKNNDTKKIVDYINKKVEPTFKQLA